MNHTRQEKYLCAKRELAMSQRVYPRWVSRGQMKQDQADYQIAVMEEIAADYAPLSEKQNEQ